MFRRLFLGASAAAALALALGSSGCAVGRRALADTPPIVFVHGNGDSAALWQTTLWRFESNGWPRERLFALQQPYPLARDDDSKEQPGRNSSAEHMAFLKAEVEKVLAQTGATQVVLVGNSRGGYAIRNYYSERWRRQSGQPCDPGRHTQPWRMGDPRLSGRQRIRRNRPLPEGAERPKECRRR